jgi:hypothetical protein
MEESGRKFWTLAEKTKRQADTFIRQGWCQFSDAEKANTDIPKQMDAT